MERPGKVYLTIYQGSTFTKSFTWLTGPLKVPMNLTGYTARLQFRVDYLTPVLLELNTNNGGITIPNSTTGEFVLNISSSDTSNLNFNEALWDLEFTAPDMTVIRRLEGKAKLSLEVTR